MVCGYRVRASGLEVVVRKLVPALAACLIAAGAAFAAPSSAQSNDVCPPGYTHSTGFNNIDQCVRDGTVAAQYPTTAWRAYYAANPDAVADLTGGELQSEIDAGRITSSHVRISTVGRTITITPQADTTDLFWDFRCTGTDDDRVCNTGSKPGGELKNCSGSGIRRTCEFALYSVRPGNSLVPATTFLKDRPNFRYGACRGPYTVENLPPGAEYRNNRIVVASDGVSGPVDLSGYYLTGTRKAEFRSAANDDWVEIPSLGCVLPPRSEPIVHFSPQRKSGTSRVVSRYVDHDSDESTPRGCVMVVSRHTADTYSRTHCMSSTDARNYETNSGIDISELPICPAAGGTNVPPQDKPTCKATN